MIQGKTNELAKDASYRSCLPRVDNPPPVSELSDNCSGNVPIGGLVAFRLAPVLELSSVCLPHPPAAQHCTTLGDD